METFKYNCIYCLYKTNNGQGWYQHNRTDKHIKNKQKYEEENLEKDLGSNICNDPGLTPGLLPKKLQNGQENGQAEKKDFICNFCQKSLSKQSHLTRHYKTCKMKKQINKSGLYCMWNYKMVDEHGDSYFKLGRTSSRKSRISGYASEYGVSVNEIQFIYEVEFENEVFAEKFLFYLLDNYRMFKKKELFKVNSETIKNTMNQLKTILDNTPKIHKIDMIFDNFDTLMEQDLECIGDENEKEHKKYLKTVLNGDYEVINQIKNLDGILRPFTCEYCKKKYPTQQYLKYHQENHCNEYKKVKRYNQMEIKRKLEEERKELERKEIERI